MIRMYPAPAVRRRSADLLPDEMDRLRANLREMGGRIVGSAPVTVTRGSGARVAGYFVTWEVPA